MRMGNQPSHLEGSPQPHRYNTRHGSRSRNLSLATTVLPDRTVGSVRNESGTALDVDVDVKAEPWTSETGSEFSGSTSPTGRSTPCPTELPPPRTIEGARKMLTRICVVFRNRHLEVEGLMTGLGGECGRFSGCDGGLAYELQMTGLDLVYLQQAMPTFAIQRDGAPVAWSQKLLGDLFAVLDGYGRVGEDIVRLCGKMRKVQTGERLPEASDLEWLKKNITPDAVKLAARVKHLTSRSQVVRFDIGQESSGF